MDINLKVIRVLNIKNYLRNWNSMRSKIESYLGFATRSRNLITGSNTCLFAMNKKKVKLLILASDISENTMKKFSITKSDEAMNDMFTLENLFELVTDSYMQLAQQRFIAQMPEKLMLTKNAQDKINFSAQIQKQLGASDEMALALAKASPIYKDAYKTIEKYSKATHALSMAYMITTSAGDVFSQAKSYGFDNFTSSVIGLGTYVGLGTLFKTNYFGGMLTGSIATEEAKKVKYLASNWLKNNSKEIASDASKNVSQEMKVGFFKKWGKRISDHIKNHYDDVTTGQFGIVSGSINEGLEELSEEFVMDAAIQFGKGINEVRSAITGKEYSNNYNYLYFI